MILTSDLGRGCFIDDYKGGEWHVSRDTKWSWCPKATTKKPKIFFESMLLEPLDALQCDQNPCSFGPSKFWNSFKHHKTVFCLHWNKMWTTVDNLYTDCFDLLGLISTVHSKHWIRLWQQANANLSISPHHLYFLL